MHLQYAAVLRLKSLITEKSNRASAPTKVPLSKCLIALTRFLSQPAFTSQVLSHSGRSTSVCLADLQITQYREQGPCPSAPSCVCSDALIWAKMSKASFQAHERGQTLLPCGGGSEEGGGGRGRQRDCVSVCGCFCAAAVCCNLLLVYCHSCHVYEVETAVYS